VYSTCLFCHSPLGANELIEHFPVGRRLAFDATKGRLWVVCRACARWNLTPLEARWEAIEECERVFRSTRTRYATDNIGIARVHEGTTLVRIGDPQRPEMAAWRYGDQFKRRRLKYTAIAASAAVGVGSVAIVGPALGLLSWTTALTLFNAAGSVRDFRTAARVPIGDNVVRLSRLALASAQIRPDVGQGFVIHFAHRSHGRIGDRILRGVGGQQETVTLHGNDAVRAARVLLPRINQAGGRQSEVAMAVNALEGARSVDDMFSDAARTPHESLPYWKRPVANWGRVEGPFVIAASLPVPVRLALEMALHEADERRALQGELAELEARWREAEEVAAIADDLLVPSAVSNMLSKLRG
jgi:hypothetical protein